MRNRFERGFVVGEGVAVDVVVVVQAVGTS
jgi:hypothetical protein